MEGSAMTRQDLAKAEQGGDAAGPDTAEAPRAQRAAEFSTQIGPVITSTHAEQLADENTEDYIRALERYEHMDWTPISEA